MRNDLLLEIGLEEVPARFLRQAMNQLKDKTEKWLIDNRIEYERIEAYATPRRLAVYAAAISSKQSDISEEAKGPSRKIAEDGNGGWSKAALGFAKSQGVAPDELYYKEVAGVDYVYARKNSIGVHTSEVLPAGLTSIISSLTFPKNMRWGSNEFKFVRPIRWLVALHGADIVPMEIVQVQAGRITRGHRFLGREVELETAMDYVEKLREQFVYVKPEEREHLIREQISELANRNGWQIPIQADLLDEVVFLVEFPTALSGGFDPDFLHIPQEVLITSMREHQRYFPVLNAEGGLLPHFVTVRNGDRVSIEQVAKGNEKVLRARLSDARFFYNEDQKVAIADSLLKLETVVYHEELGSIADKARRITAIADRLANKLGLDAVTAATVHRSAEICKFDLVTQMVYEFPELQGMMGEDYARKAGEQEAVARAIFEHYQPRSASDHAPASIVGAVVAIADKLDTLVGCFSLGLIPTGSQDPYALRRQASGITQIWLEHQLPLQLSDIIAAALEVHAANGLVKREAADVTKDLIDFFALRIKNVLESRVRYDVTDAVMAAGFDHLPSVIRRAEALAIQVQQPGFKSVVESINRAANLAAKADSRLIDPELFAEQSEHQLFQAWTQDKDNLTALLANAKEADAFLLIASWREPITSFFDHVMVMAEDPAVRANRLALLAGIDESVKQAADLQRLVW